MGFVLWGALSTLALLAGAAVALRVGRSFTPGELLVAAPVTALALVVGAIQLLGYTDLLYPSHLAALVSGTALLLLAATRPTLAEWRNMGARVRGALTSALRTESIVPGLAAALLVAFLAAAVYLMPSWNWDAVWYHNPISAYAFQEHSLRWVESNIPYVNSYPKNIELLALWNVIFSRDDRLLDAVQLPMALLGVVSLATLLRRSGASPSLSLGLGTCWLLVPAVFLNIPSNYIDVACASLWLAAVLFLARTDATAAHRFFGALALGLYLGSKVTGALHAAMIAPVVIAVLLVQLWRSREGRWRQAFLALTVPILILSLGIWTYARDWIRFRNPVWPVHMKAAGQNFPGALEMWQFNTPPWGGPDNVMAMLRSWFDPSPNYIVDVRSGGFGLLWPVVLLPLVVAACGVALYRLRHRQGTSGMLAVTVLMVTAIATPAAWWCRYTLGVPAAGLLAAGIVLHRLPRTWMPRLGLAIIGLFAIVQAIPALKGFRLPPKTLVDAAFMTPVERVAIRLDTWQHPGLDQRDSILLPGDAAVYDDSASFIYQLWRHDWANRVLYRPTKGPPPGLWRLGIENENARWAVVQRGSGAAGALKSAGWRYLGDCGSEPCGVWARPRPAGGEE